MKVQTAPTPQEPALYIDVLGRAARTLYMGRYSAESASTTAEWEDLPEAMRADYRRIGVWLVDVLEASYGSFRGQTDTGQAVDAIVRTQKK